MVATTTGDGGGEGDRTSARRRYDSPVRRQQKAETRERIVAAGAALVHGFATWDWSELTFRAVADEAGVGERTVYRHFPTERDLHDAIMARLAEEAGVRYDGIALADVAEVAARIFRSLGRFDVPGTVARAAGPTFLAVDDQRRAALLGAVEREAPSWPARERVRLAAVLDILWTPPSYERLVSGWDMGADEAIEVIAWAIGALVAPALGDHDGG